MPAKKPEKPSPTMLKGLTLARRGGLVRFRGGFWSYPDCPTRDVRYLDVVETIPMDYVDIRTVDACVRRGWLIRRGPGYEAPADLSAAGQELTDQLRAHMD